MQRSRRSRPSGPSRSAADGDSRILTEQKIRDLFCPYNPIDRDMVVLGVLTRGPNTEAGKNLPQLYDMAGVPMYCHSCGRPIDGSQLFKDHQPPTRILDVYRIYCFNGGRLPGQPGKIGTILDYILSHSLPLYEFDCKVGGRKRSCQTNSLQTARKLAINGVQQVDYSTNLTKQYLYPHCKNCSDMQGHTLW